MFRVNGVHNRFTLAPRGRDGNLSLIYNYSNTGQVKFFNFASANRIGVRIDEPSFDGEYRSEETNLLHNLQWKDLIGEWLVKASLSLSTFYTERRLGNMHLEPSDETGKLRVDVQRLLSDELRLSAGVEIERMKNIYRGTIPRNPTVFDPEAEIYVLDERYATERGGIYVEIESQLSRHLAGSMGARMDRHSIAREMVVDPRLSLRYSLGKQTTARMSLGIYHQFPQPFQFNQSTGNPDLKSQRAKHFIIGFEHFADLLMRRIENRTCFGTRGYTSPISETVLLRG